MTAKKLLARILAALGLAPTPPAPPVLDFRFGGFDGSGAQEDSRVQIGFVKMGKDRMTYRFVAGDLSAWGLARTQADAIACAFYFDEKAGKWVGGKFDFISTSRLSRSFNNIRSGYRRWNADAFFAAKRRAFCICSKDGRNRTNLAEADIA